MGRRPANHTCAESAAAGRGGGYPRQMFFFSACVEPEGGEDSAPTSGTGDSRPEVAWPADCVPAEPRDFLDDVDAWSLEPFFPDLALTPLLELEIELHAEEAGCAVRTEGEATTWTAPCALPELSFYFQEGEARREGPTWTFTDVALRDDAAYARLDGVSRAEGQEIHYEAFTRSYEDYILTGEIYADADIVVDVDARRLQLHGKGAMHGVAWDGDPSRHPDGDVCVAHDLDGGVGWMAARSASAWTAWFDGSEDCAPVFVDGVEAGTACLPF